MKKFKFSALFLMLNLLISNSIFSQHIQSLTDRQIKDYCKAIAVQHSIALEGMYAQIGSLCSPMSDLEQKVDFKTRNFVIGNLQSNVYDAINFSGTKALVNGTTISDHLRTLRYPFSNALYNALDQLQQLLQSAISQTTFSVNIETLIDSKFPTLANNIEKLIYAGAAYICTDSYTYWDGSIDNWSSAIAQYGGAVAGFNYIKADPKSIAVTDLKGAVTGLVRGAYAGLTVGTIAIPGIGTVAGGAACALTGLIGGAIGSSAMAGVKYLWDKIFD